ncbi:hypothetical protein HYS03_00910 [Candidatus Woesebacteria bacterium]|nr:hypothetical protein [Candidatus Woesebacteria bacterium]QQG47217.1 MAG: hypothetical protein HY044_03720 [Candidatus Woesebacteria bacterium]
MFNPFAWFFNLVAFWVLPKDEYPWEGYFVRYHKEDLQQQPILEDIKDLKILLILYH